MQRFVIRQPKTSEMGSLFGHALPGSFFIIFAVWWMANMFWDYFNSRRRNTKFTSTAIYRCRCCCGRLKQWPTEAYVKLFFVSIGTLVEGSVGIKDYINNADYQNNLQHTTMFVLFGINAVIDILLHYNAPVPPYSDYVSMAIAVASEGLLFKFHLHGRKDLDILVHTLLVYSLFASTTTVFMEMKYRHNIMVSLGRPFFTLVQGTWFWQAGWILYPPFPWSFHWDEEDHGQMMIATTIFIWHLAIDFMIMLGIGGIVACVQRRYFPSRPGDSVALKRLINSDANGEAGLNLVDNQSDDEMDFDKSGVQ